MSIPSTRKKQSPFGIQPSTRAFLKEAGCTPGFSILDILHGYVYLRWSYTYIAIGLGEHWINRAVKFIQGLNPFPGPAKADSKAAESHIADVYHGKVLRTDAARQLVSVQENVELRNLESIIPYPYARDIVLQDPDHIVVIDCPCRSAREKPCLPIDVCLIVGEPFASFIAEHHPDKTRWIEAEEACDILEREHERGRVHQAFFKDATLGRFYVICNCCSCCCGAMQAKRNGTPLLAASGFTGRIDADTCTCCGDCLGICSFGAIEWTNDEPNIIQERCMGCGVCSAFCQTDSITMTRDLSQSQPLEIESLISNCEGALSA